MPADLAVARFSCMVLDSRMNTIYLIYLLYALLGLLVLYIAARLLLRHFFPPDT